MVTLYKNIKDGWTLDEDHGKIRGLGIHVVIYTSPFPDIHTTAPIISVTPVYSCLPNCPREITPTINQHLMEVSSRLRSRHLLTATQRKLSVLLCHCITAPLVMRTSEVIQADDKTSHLNVLQIKVGESAVT